MSWQSCKYSPKAFLPPRLKFSGQTALVTNTRKNSSCSFRTSQEAKSTPALRLSQSSLESCSFHQRYFRFRLFVAPKQKEQFRQSNRKEESMQSKLSRTNEQWWRRSE